ncbi:hypothetical protein E2C01_053206 [Portunus trituberculatus]|uniref:RNase H type-1 domain-containing protein n=1 Tax=Portunus trituberculatus TaxID=210409 RepID=A0A5B7GFS7_PORTR|nr:hypothetical protein [Portunus trituberculatus]
MLTRTVAAALVLVQQLSRQSASVLLTRENTKNTIKSFKFGAGATVHFTWIFFHVGIPLNEKADRHAHCAFLDDTVDPGTEYTPGYVKSNVKDFVHSSISDQLERLP